MNARPRDRSFPLAVLAVALLATAGCKRRHHHHDAGTVSTTPVVNPYATPPGVYTGQIPGQVPGQVPGTIPGQIPGQVPGMMPNQIPAMGLTVAAPPPVATAPDNPAMPVPPPGVMRQLPQPSP